MADPIKISALPAAVEAVLTHVLAASNPDTAVTEKLTVAQIAAILPSLSNPGAEQDVASASTVDLTPYSDTMRFRITGATGIGAFAIGANKMTLVRFAAGPTVTHNATTLILPTGANLTAAADDVAWLTSDGSGNVRVIAWFRANGTALVGASTNLVDQAINAETDVASAGTVNLAAASTTAFRFRITGTTGITAITLGNNKWALLRFAGALTLTHNATTLILPTAANIVTVTDDMALIATDGSGNVRVIAYWRKSGAPVALVTFAMLASSAIASQAEAEAGVSTTKLMTPQRVAQAIAANTSPAFAYESAQQTVTAAGPLTLAHGLGAKPKHYAAFLQCTTADQGYSIGDEIEINPSINTEGSGARGLSISPDATNINVRYGSAAIVFQAIHKTSGNVVALTNANWRLVVRAAL